MLQHRTPLQRARVALTLSGVLVLIAFAIGPFKNGYSVFVLMPGMIAATALVGDSATLIGSVIAFIAATMNWSIPIFIVLTFTNPRARRRPNEKNA